MKKELPKMYHNEFNKDINNNRTFFSSLTTSSEKKFKNSLNSSKITNDNNRFVISQKIYNIFNSSDYIYKADVTIVTENEELKKRIIGKNADNLITIDNEYIPISIIKDIYKS